MNYLVRLMLVCMLMIGSMLMIKAAPAYAAEAMQMWKCELMDDTTEEEVIAMAQEWLKAAKTMKGGENFELSLFFPVAVDKTGEIDFLMVVTAPSFAEWGKFWDGYEGSPASKVDQGSASIAICPDSALWEEVEIK